MLTEAEKKWLRRRQDFPKRSFNKHYFCAYCEKFTPDRLCHSALCPIDVAHVVPIDAAQFEALVAAIMPYIVFRVVERQAEQKEITIDAWECLKLARLAVEAEQEPEPSGLQPWKE